MPQAGVLATITEFVGAVALGARVTDTIKNGIIGIDRFEGRPGVLMLAMGCAELGNAIWLMTATGLGFPVSTTHTIVGSLIGAGFATQANITWAWKDGSVSQVAASWFIAPAVAGCFAAIIFATVKYAVLERKDSFKWAMRLIPVYLAGTAAILALFLAIELPTTPDLEEVAGEIAGSILAVFFGVLIIAYVFFMPFFRRKLIRQDPRLRVWHIPLGPLLNQDNPPLFWPGKGEEFVTNYYADSYGNVRAGKKDDDKLRAATSAPGSPEDSLRDEEKGVDPSVKASAFEPGSPDAAANTHATHGYQKEHVEPYARFIGPGKDLSWIDPRKWWGYVKFILLQGVTRDVVTHDSAHLQEVHARAHRYDVRVEHLWTYCQVVSAMMMSIAHGSNDVANAVGPWAASYQTFRSGIIDTESDTPIWFLAVAGLLLGLGFWFYGHHIMRALGNKITQMSPTRGFSIELGAAITILLASRLALPVSTTQSLTGAALGVALMNYDLGSVNWRQVAKIFLGWILTLPCAGLLAGLTCLMALNTPSF